MPAGPDYVYDYGAIRVEVFVTGTWRENCYLVTDREASAMAWIDPGDEADRLAAHSDAQPHPVSWILCTHAHFDHVGAIDELSRHSGLPCQLHREDLQLFKRAPLYALAFEKRSITVPKAAELFDDGATFSLGSHDFKAVRSPGHTPGSVSFRYGPLLFVGDTLMHSKRGRTDLPGGDAVALDQSIAALLEEFEDDLVLLPGHGKPWTLEEARTWWAQDSRNPS
jgi:glyoxylase-like metal-dependent hydrolase (beta-lactamase superfamily II)